AADDEPAVARKDVVASGAVALERDVDDEPRHAGGDAAALLEGRAREHLAHAPARAAPRGLRAVAAAPRARGRQAAVAGGRRAPDAHHVRGVRRVVDAEDVVAVAAPAVPRRCEPRLPD